VAAHDHCQARDRDKGVLQTARKLAKDVFGKIAPDGEEADHSLQRCTLDQVDSGYSVGFSYDSSPVDNNHRTFDLPVDEAYKLSAAYFWKGARKLDYSLGGTMYFVGEANINQTVQGVRAAGKYDSNYILFLGGTVRYRF
jgi:hypothetical protein